MLQNCSQASRNLIASLVKRSEKNPTQFMSRRLGISEPTARKYLKHPREMRIKDCIALGLTEAEIRGLMC